MKKALKTIFTSTLLLVSLLSLATSCGKKKPTSSGTTIQPTTTVPPTTTIAPTPTTTATPATEHQHTFEADWSTSDTEHWHKATCEHKDEKDALGAHVYDDDVDTTCNICGYVRTIHVHTFATEWTFNDTEHWHAATCEHKDEKDAVALHTFDDGEITTEPGYGVEGVKTFTCTVCQKKKTESVSALTAFFMPIQDRFSVTGKGTIVVGTIFSGTVKVGDVLTLSNLNREITVTGITKFNKEYESASQGEEVSLLITGATKDEIKSGYSLFTPSSKQYYNQIKVNLTALTKEEGGRKVPFSTNYQPQIKFYPYGNNESINYAGEVTGCVILPSDLEYFMPGETHVVTIILKTSFILDKGMEIIIVESGKKIAYGSITALEHHEHDNNYDEMGKCNVCGFDQYVSFTFDSEMRRYYYETNLNVNEKIFLKVTPKDSNDLEKEWRDHVEGASYDDFNYTVYDIDGNVFNDHLKTGSTYIIIIEGKVDKNDVTFWLIDSNDMD